MKTLLCAGGVLSVRHPARSTRPVPCALGLPPFARKFRRAAQTVGMKLTTIFLSAVLIAYGLGACLYALTGIDLLFLLTAGNAVIYRSLLSLAGVAALWLVFWLVAFRPTRDLR